MCLPLLLIAAAALANAVRLACQRCQAARWTRKVVRPAPRAARIVVVL